MSLAIETGIEYHYILQQPLHAVSIMKKDHLDAERIYGVMFAGSYCYHRLYETKLRQEELRRLTQLG